MGVNKPVAAMRREGPVKKRTQLKTKLGGVKPWTKHSQPSGEFMAVKKPAARQKAAKKFKGVRRKKSAKKVIARGLANRRPSGAYR
jgi:hypothetical protein